MKELKGVVQKVVTVPQPVIHVDEAEDLESLVEQANRFLDSMSSLVLNWDESMVDNRIQVLDTDDDTEMARLRAEQVQELSLRVQMLQNMLYDRCI
ncbi:MAG: hypothetical protein HQL73_09415 [Magnetococcales bacterium]|nr:hypothetical protein [Magnetococcales bacterium]